MTSCLIIAGEKSGEEHSQSFFPELQKKLNAKYGDVSYFGVGGDTLESQGVELLYHLNDFSTWGVTEALKKVPFYYRANKRIISEVKKRETKLAILIDFQTFNLKLALQLKKMDVKVMYYVAPQAWVWKAWRAKYLQIAVDTLFCILPFEKKWFTDRGVSKAISIEHPLYRQKSESLEGFTRTPKNFSNEAFNILLLPGSRKFEIELLLPSFLRVCKSLKNDFNISVSLVKSSSVDERLFRLCEGIVDTYYSDDQLDTALKAADFSFASSGTVNLSLAIFEVPSIIGYDLNLLNRFIAEVLVNYQGYVSLPNLILNEEVYPELVGNSLSDYNLEFHARKIFKDQELYQHILSSLAKIKSLTKGENVNVSEYIMQRLEEN